MASTHTDPLPRPRYVVLVPAKRPAVAKSRLAVLGDSVRADLAAAFAADTVAAALATPDVARVLVVTDDHLLARGLSDLGADVLPDGTGGDLNATLVQAAAEMHRRHPDLCPVALCADLPALRPGDLAQALACADATRMSFVADADRVGTTTVIAPSLARFRPHFGPASRREHLALGAFEIDAFELPTLRRDVDDPDGLVLALRLGVGPSTSLVSSLLHRAI